MVKLRRIRPELRSQGKPTGGSTPADESPSLEIEDLDPIEQHKLELQRLEQSDPEFYKFLNENDEGLLQFGEDGGESDSDNDNNSVANEEEEFGAVDEDEHDDDNFANQQTELTMDIFEECKRLAMKGNMAATRRLIQMFRAACQPSNEVDEDDPSDHSSGNRSRYVIHDADIFQTVMTESIDLLHDIFARHLGLPEDGDTSLSSEQLDELSKHKNWRRLQPLILSFFKMISQLIESVGMLPKHLGMAAFLLNNLRKYLPFLTPLPRAAKSTVKILLAIWGQRGSTALEDHDLTQKLRELAFQVVRRFAELASGGIREDIFRASYQKYAHRCKAMGEFNVSIVLYMSKSLVDLYRTDVALAYQEAFVYIRQLSLHVRSAFVKKGEAAMKIIRSWQFVNCLRLWTSVVCSEPSESRGLGMLVYPLSQIMMAVMQLLPSAYYSPLRLHLVMLLQQLAAHCRVFIPTALVLCDMLHYDDLFAKPTPTTEVAPRLHTLLALPSNSLGKAPVRDALVTQILAILKVEAELYRYHVGAAEYFYLPSKKLRAFSKRCKSGKWREICRSIIHSLSEYSKACRDGRVERGLVPTAVQEFECLRPQGIKKVAVRIQSLLDPIIKPAELLPPTQPSRKRPRDSDDDEDEEDEDDDSAEDSS